MTVNPAGNVLVTWVSTPPPPSSPDVSSGPGSGFVKPSIKARSSDGAGSFGPATELARKILDSLGVDFILDLDGVTITCQGQHLALINVVVKNIAAALTEVLPIYVEFAGPDQPVTGAKNIVSFGIFRNELFKFWVRKATDGNRVVEVTQNFPDGVVVADTPTACPSGPDMEMDKSHAREPFIQGREEKFILKVTNVGTEPVEGPVFVSYSFPSGIKVVTADGKAGDGWDCRLTAGGGTLDCETARRFEPGDSSFIEVVVEVNKFAFDGGTANKSSRTNKADVNIAGGDINPSNNEDEDTVEIRRLPDLKIEKATGDKFEVGSVARYVLTVTDEGSGNADGGVTVIDNLPAGLRFMSAIKPQFWTCTVAGRTITCERPGRFDAGASETIEIVVGVTSSAFPSVTNVASVQAPGDYDLSNNGPVELLTPVTKPSIDEDLPCGVSEVEGWLEPSQGVWQYDYTFPNKVGKRLVQASPTLFLADLAMVRERATQLFGIFDPVGGERLDRRDQIMIKGKTNGSTNVPVKVRFTLIQGGAITPLHETEVRNLPLRRALHLGTTLRVPSGRHRGHTARQRAPLHLWSTGALQDRSRDRAPGRTSHRHKGDRRRHRAQYPNPRHSLRAGYYQQCQ